MILYSVFVRVIKSSGTKEVQKSSHKQKRRKGSIFEPKKTKIKSGIINGLERPP